MMFTSTTNFNYRTNFFSGFDYEIDQSTSRLGSLAEVPYPPPPWEASGPKVNSGRGEVNNRGVYGVNVHIGAIKESQFSVYIC